MHLLLVLLWTFSFFCRSDALPNQFCKPHLSLVPIDHPTYGFYPFFVQLHRCGGSCKLTQPTIESCTATETKNVTVNLFSLAKNIARQAQLVNHTKCGCQCVTKASDCTAVQIWKPNHCSCTCRYTHTPPRPCPEGQRWSSGHCACMCDKAPQLCPIGKYWSPRACSCVCNENTIRKCQARKQTINDKCECMEIGVGAHKGDKPKDDLRGSKLTLLLMIGEFFLMCLVFDAVLYHKGAGVTHSIVTRLGCKGKPSKAEEKPEPAQIGSDFDISSVSTREDYLERECNQEVVSRM